MNELIKSLRELCEMTALCDDYSCFVCPYEKKCSSYKNGRLSAVFRQAADAIEKLSKLHETQKKNLSVLTDAYMKSWIPVTERLPEDRRDVQITVFWHDAWRTMYGYFDGDFWHLYAPMHTEVADVEVIGWMEKSKPMPLPELPKEE